MGPLLPILSLRVYGADSALQRNVHFYLEEAAERCAVLLQLLLPPAQRLHLPVGHGRASRQQRGQHGRVEAALLQEATEGERSHAGPAGRHGSRLPGG